LQVIIGGELYDILEWHGGLLIYLMRKQGYVLGLDKFVGKA
jgi:hypothetical protein